MQFGWDTVCMASHYGDKPQVPLLLFLLVVALVLALGGLCFNSWLSSGGPKATSPIKIDSFDDPRFVWHNGAPGSGGRGGSWRVDAGSLTVVPSPGLDYWSRTFYKPLLIKSDAQVLADKHVYTGLISSSIHAGAPVSHARTHARHISRRHC